MKPIEKLTLVFFLVFSFNLNATDPLQLLTNGSQKTWKLTAYSISENGFVLNDTCKLNMKFQFNAAGYYRVDTSCHKNIYNTAKNFQIIGNKLITSIDTSEIITLSATQLVLRKKVALPGVYNPTLSGTSFTTFTGI